MIDDVQAVAATLNAPVLVAGAFARDLHLAYGLGVEVGRKTDDIDLALSVKDWPTFRAVRQRLIDGGRFRSLPGTGPCLIHVTELPVDIVPFGAVETANRLLLWPPDGAVHMNVFGFAEALETAQMVSLPSAVQVRVVTLPALALLKIVAWTERHLASPRKDAVDLMLVLQHYLEAVGPERLWEDFRHWTDDDDFDYELANARMLGHDIALMLQHEGRVKVAAMVAPHTDANRPTKLPIEMDPHQPERALALLKALHQGLQESASV